MRAIVTGLVAVGLLGSSGEAAAGTEWVVLRVERVEVAVARADGSPWDDGDPNGSQGAPDLAARLAIDATSYVSAVAADRIVHDFAYDFLVPLDAVPPTGLAVEIFDQDGNDVRRGEELGTIRVTRSDIADLLASSSRVKTFSHDSVTRLEVTSRRYRKSSRRQFATVGPGKREVSAAIRKIIQSRYLAGVQRCHERLLRSDPMATGRMRVRYSVGPTGGVVKASAKGLERSLETCLESLMVKWRFGAPRDAHGKPTSEDVEAELLLDAR